MNVSLTPELEQYVREKVRGGRYGSASEFVRESLRSMQEREQENEGKLEALRQDIAVGIRQLDRGEWVDGPTAISKIRAKLERMKAS